MRINRHFCKYLFTALNQKKLNVFQLIQFQPSQFKFNKLKTVWALSSILVMFSSNVTANEQVEPLIVPATSTHVANPALTTDITIGHFSQGDLTGWEEKEFSGQTDYQIVTDTSTSANTGKAKKILKANSNNSASGLFKEQRIDLQKTPYLHWSWKTQHLYSGLNEVKKEGDDFVARIYIVIDGGMFIWKTKALNYVWSSSFKENEFWPNPYTSNAIMFAVESGTKNIGKWVKYKRNVSVDLQKVLGKEVRYIDAIAVMTDSDSSGQQATTYYGDIYFSAE